MKEGRFRCGEEILPHEGGEALAQAAQRSCGCPLPGRAQGQVGRGCEQPGLVERVLAHGRGWNWMICEVPSCPNHAMILFYNFGLQVTMDNETFELQKLLKL